MSLWMKVGEKKNEDLKCECKETVHVMYYTVPELGRDYISLDVSI